MTSQIIAPTQDTATTPPVLEVLSPYDLSSVEKLELCDWAYIDTALKRARRLYETKKLWIPAFRRAEILTSLAGRVEADAEEYAHLIAREGGKPITDARIEVMRAISGIRYAAAHIGEVMRGEVIDNGFSAAPAGRRMTTSRSPLGVVAAISAFNHPLNLVVHQVVPAVAVGAPVIVKPSLDTPLCCLKLVELLTQAGLPEGWVQVVLCDNQLAEKLATDPRVSFLNFIGSAKVGWRLRSLLPPGTRCALEHGGNAPVIMLTYANQDAAIPTILKGGMSHAGQVCVSVQRVFAPWAEVGHFARKLGEAAERLEVGNPLMDATQVGPLISPQQVLRVHEWVQEAIAGGAKLMSGGLPVSKTQYQPTILLDPPDHVKVSSEEIFGPVICVYGYDEAEDAVRRANASKYAFQAAVWGREYDAIQRVVDGLDAATVMVNDHTAFRVDWMPFGGRKHSGLGVGGIPYTMLDYTQAKLVVG